MRLEESGLGYGHPQTLRSHGNGERTNETADNNIIQVCIGSRLIRDLKLFEALRRLLSIVICINHL